MSDSPDDNSIFADLAAADPEIAALLDFAPVPRKLARVDGWDAEIQRAFIVALVMTGSPRRAADAVGRRTPGVENLREAEGAEEFSRAWDGALELHARRRSQRLKANLARLASPAFAGEGDHAEHGGGVFPDDDKDDGEDEPAATDELADALSRKFVIKLRQERKARLAGRIAEADFYLRQISFFEVAIELLTGSAIDTLAGLRRDGVSLIHIADTAGTRLLDSTRRKAWLELELERRRAARGDAPSPPSGGEGRGEGAWGDPDRPDEDFDPEDLDLYPPHLLENHGSPGSGFRTEPLPSHGPHQHPAEGYSSEQWAALDEQQRAQAYAEQYARAGAEEQVKWEQEMITIARAMKETGDPWGESPSPLAGEGWGEGA